MTDTLSFTLFDTPLGRCAIVWSERGLAGVLLPARDEAATRRQLLRRFPEASEAAPPASVAQALMLIVKLLSGEKADLSAIPLDLDRVNDFERKVYAVARQIPPGATLTYGDIAARLGDKMLARDVGQAMGRNPFPIVVPCHRVVAANGKLGGFSAPGGASTKRRMLAIEGAAVAGQLGLF